MKRILKVYRAPRFSPNSVKRDRDIMDAVGNILASSGCMVCGVNEEQLCSYAEADAILSMARTPSALSILEDAEAHSVAVMNTPGSVRACRRSNVDRLMREHGLPAAPAEGRDGYWVKRGDDAAQSRDDVAFAKDANERDRLIEDMRRRGIRDIVVTAHVIGDVVKFYGVSGTGFFCTFRHGADSYSKFGLETAYGSGGCYGFDAGALEADASRLAGLTGIDAYGGDCIIRPDGSYAIIDFNDWPSFAACRNEAAEAIASRIKDRL